MPTFKHRIDLGIYFQKVWLWSAFVAAVRFWLCKYCVCPKNPNLEPYTFWCV